MEVSSLFTSAREKAIWIFSLIILLGIFLSLIIGRPLLDLFSNQNVQAEWFLLGMLIIGACMILYGITSRPDFIDVVLVLGIVAVYLLLFLRLGLPERSHLIEYSALSLTIHQALFERGKQGSKIRFVGLWAIGITSLIGLFDETIQIFIPDRVFDLNDILFNCLSAIMAVTVSSFVLYMRKKIIKKN